MKNLKAGYAENSLMGGWETKKVLQGLLFKLSSRSSILQSTVDRHCSGICINAALYFASKCVFAEGMLSRLLSIILEFISKECSIISEYFFISAACSSFSCQLLHCCEILVE